MTEPHPKISLIVWIMLALLAWASVLAAGSYLYGQTLLWQRAAIILSSVLLFIAFWLGMLANRRRRISKE